MTNVAEHLWHLGIGRRYKGYRAITLAVELCIENKERLQCAQKYLFKPIAERLGCKSHNVECNIRTAIARAWHNNPNYLSFLAGVPLDQPPTVIRFLDILVTFVLRRL